MELTLARLNKRLTYRRITVEATPAAAEWLVLTDLGAIRYVAASTRWMPMINLLLITISSRSSTVVAPRPRGRAAAARRPSRWCAAA